MTTAPPSYSLDDAPPSYEEVVRKFESLIPSNPTATQVYDAALRGLTQADLDVLVANHEANFPLKTDQEKADFSRGAAETSSAADLQSALEISAKAAAATAGDVRLRFDGLQSKLESLDLRWNTEWAKRFVATQQSFQSVIDDSQANATKTYNFTRKLDNQDILYCNDSTKTLADRKTRIQGTIDAAATLKTENGRITTQLGTVSTDLQSFISDFIAWARGKEGELSAELARIKRELIELEGKIAELETAAEAIKHVGQGLLPIMEGLAACFPPYGTLIAIGGLIIAGVQLASTTALMIEIAKAKQQVKDKTRERDQLEADLEQIREAREQVEAMSSADLSSFGSTISSMTSTPSAAETVAQQIKKWLEDGAPENGRPAYMGFRVNHNATSCEIVPSFIFVDNIQPTPDAPDAPNAQRMIS
ncbi:uncharacterized protein BO66DRAFT_472042 [Aspergillus aculeatinus CBS 121060]|uniref:Uncharacterized protein n=1 Tax=Aspergillus aculeatinus CBS 121060 TaxID=1448322 RepID=A0ACD1H6J7_9EURO|nr:hypothetical protein BO66DRAFT_472042 [Aspergillus aculeatinus CBS 121060]RAH69237.1 hypothetical protein BO66DRAFT_472042 [Aspergillus aculeatinus CBS 121060]